MTQPGQPEPPSLPATPIGSRHGCGPSDPMKAFPETLARLTKMELWLPPGDSDMVGSEVGSPCLPKREGRPKKWES